MIRITQLKLHPDETKKSLERSVRKALHLKESEAFSVEVLRRSIDARKKPDVYEIYTVSVQMKDAGSEKKILRRGLKNVSAYEPVRYRYALKEDMLQDGSGTDTDRLQDSSDTDPDRPLIIGTGPAGLFCGLLLARQGLRPVLIERGQRARERRKCVRIFWETGLMDVNSNVQFGEGGAGTFSDGKLNTGVKDPEGRIRFVLETFVSAGADPQILYSAAPHVGTDILEGVVTSLTDEICMRGGEVYFETRMDRITQDAKGIWSIFCSGIQNRKKLVFSARNVVLAIGHSSRDTFFMLNKSGIVMNPKAFAVGVRIQHPQAMIDRSMYGNACRYQLPAASYKLTHRLGTGRGVYSFCMCPGGYVVNASSEQGLLAVNGMSFHDRSGHNANSAIVVTVSPEEMIGYTGHDLTDGKKDPLIGVEFQRQLERAAYEAGEGSIPVQRFTDFALPPEISSPVMLPDYEPQILGRWKPADIRSIFPADIREGIIEGILSWEHVIEGFSGPDALLCAAESRTSSPVRIERGADLQALNHPGLYPCGEGAGYAGGITSAAIDGLKVAEKILHTHSSQPHP